MVVSWGNCFNLFLVPFKIQLVPMVILVLGFHFFFATLMFMHTSPFFQAHLGNQLSASRSTVWYLAITSAVVLGSSIDNCIPASECFW